MMQSVMRHYLVALLPILALAALILALVGVAGVQAADPITITDLTPADGSTIASDQSVVVSGFITTDSAIALVNGQPDVTVVIDGTQVTPQFVVGSGALRVGFQSNQTFSAGSHTVMVTAKNVNGETANAQSTFTATPGATTTPAATATVVASATAVPSATAAATATTAPTVAAAATATTAATVIATTATPTALPRTGGAPVDVVFPSLFGLGAAAAGIGLRLRTLGRR